MEVLVAGELLAEMLNFARERHPKEAVLLLRGRLGKDTITLTDYLFPPFATTDSISASYPIHMLPIDFSIVGTVHSHPSGSIDMSPQDMNNIYGRISLIIAYPYGSENLAAYNKQAKRIPIQVTD